MPISSGDRWPRTSWANRVRSCRTRVHALERWQRDPVKLADTARCAAISRNCVLRSCHRSHSKPATRSPPAPRARPSAVADSAGVPPTVAAASDGARAVGCDSRCQLAHHQKVVAEFYPDMSAFPDARHLVSWTAICPGNSSQPVSIFGITEILEAESNASKALGGTITNCHAARVLHTFGMRCGK